MPEPITLQGRPSNRETLKLKFQKGSIPTEQDFADWIHSSLNIVEDGIKKKSDSPLQIESYNNKIFEFFSSFGLNKEIEVGITKYEFQTPLSSPSSLSPKVVNNGITIANALEYGFRLTMGKGEQIPTIGQTGDANFHTISLKIPENEKQKMGISSLNESLLFETILETSIWWFNPQHPFFEKKIEITNYVNPNIYTSITMNTSPTIRGLGDEAYMLFKCFSYPRNDVGSSSLFGLDKNSLRFSVQNQPLVTIERNNIRFSLYDPTAPSFSIKPDGLYASNTKLPFSDFAEFLESENKEKIPFGTSVALNKNGKLVKAKEGDTPIGIISAKPAILGNNAEDWPDKYLKDDFGNMITEEIEEEIPIELDNDVYSAAERIVKLRKPKINPAYNPNQIYIPRQERPEWHIVGLLGQIPLRKGQPVAPTWVKIKDISENVELWLVK